MLKRLAIFAVVMASLGGPPPIPGQTASYGSASAQPRKNQTQSNKNQAAPILAVAPSNLGGDNLKNDPGIKTTEENESAVTISKFPTANVSIQSNAKRDIADWLAFGSGILLTIVGIFGVVVALRGVIATEKSADAALESAKAANAQIKVMKEKERARIVITFPDESDSMLIQPDSKVIGSFRLNLKNAGPTIAYNISGAYDAFASTADGASLSHDLCQLQVPSSIEANSWEQTGPLTIDSRFFGQRDNMAFYVYLRVEITYSDIFKAEKNITKMLMRREFMRTRPGEAVSSEFWENIVNSEQHDST